MLIDQATQLRSMVQQRRRASVIAVTSGKGGVGKSNVSVNLAIKLAAAGKDVVLLDADMGLANADVLVQHRPSIQPVARHRPQERAARRSWSPGPGGFRLIGGASGLARMADLSDDDRQRLITALAELEDEVDVILIDTGAGISPNVLAFTRAADHVLVVTTPEPTAITDAYAVIKVLTRGGDQRRISLLVNQVTSAAEAKIVQDRIAKVARQFLNVTVFEGGYVFADDQVPASVRKRQPFVLASPRCPAAGCITQLAIRLQQGVASAHAGGFFNRMAKWFRK